MARCKCTLRASSVGGCSPAAAGPVVCTSTLVTSTVGARGIRGHHRTSGLFRITQRVYKSRAGVVLTPDCVSPSAFLRVRVNRPGGAELWTNPRPPVEPAPPTAAPLRGGSPPDSTASTPGVSSKASGSAPAPGVHSKASSSGPPPGVSSKASPPQPADPTRDNEEESRVSDGWVPSVGQVALAMDAVGCQAGRAMG